MHNTNKLHTDEFQRNGITGAETQQQEDAMEGKPSKLTQSICMGNLNSQTLSKQQKP